MTHMTQAQEDLSFIRQAIARRTTRQWGGEAIYLVWAVYVLVGYTLIDLRPQISGWYFMIAAVPAALLSWRIANAAHARVGEIDRDIHRRATLHWALGGPLVIAVSIALQLVIPPLRGFYGGQVCVVLWGLIYFFHGVHFDGNFLWLGPLLIVGGLSVGFIPYYPWTCLGVVIAIGLSIPYLLSRRKIG